MLKINSSENIKKETLFQGEYRNFNYDRKDELQKELLFLIKENGLTISQAKEIFTNTINLLEYYGILLTIADYEKLTGRDVNSDW